MKSLDIQRQPVMDQPLIWRGRILLRVVEASDQTTSLWGGDPGAELEGVHIPSDLWTPQDAGQFSFFTARKRFTDIQGGEKLMLGRNNFLQPKNLGQLTCNFLLNHDLKLFPHVPPSQQIIPWLYNIQTNFHRICCWWETPRTWTPLLSPTLSKTTGNEQPPLLRGVSH